MRSVLDWFARPRVLIGFAVATVVANCLIVGTGALVRLTASGLGCPTWPRCTDESYVTTAEMGLHGVIEFGNRMLFFVLLLIAVGTLVAVWRQRPDLRVLAALLLFGIPFQGVIGGITVLTQLNPFVVALHLLLSAVLICGATVLLRRVRRAGKRPVTPVLRGLTRAMFVLAWIAVWLGTVVTGSGPHSGDHGAARTGFDIELVAKIHATSVWLLVLVTGYLVLRLRSRAAVALLVALLGQGAIGYAQYFLGVPVGLVLLHLLGMTVIMALATNLLGSVTSKPSGQHHQPQNSSGSMAAAMNSNAR